MRPSTSTLVVLLAAAAAVYHALPRGALFGSPVAPALAYADTQGRPHSLAAPDKPAVVVLWVTPCGYCTRSLAVLDEIRRIYPEDELDVVGFYLNRASDEEIERVAAAEGHRVTMARGQPSGPFVQQLTAGFSFRGTGRDIYIVGKDGRYRTVDSSDLKEPQGYTLDKVRTVLLNDLHLKERT